jgi:hypothetical protein
MVTIFKRQTESLKASENRRSEERLLVNLAVELTRYDPEGNAIVEQTKIEDVTSIGCRFTTQAEFHRGEIVSIRPLASGQKSLAGSDPQLFEVMWASCLGGRWSAGAKKLEGEKLASVKFPPAKGSPSQTPK